MKIFSSIIFSLYCFFLKAQNDSLSVDQFYREDQFYLTATYNMLAKKTSDIKQYNLSRGIEAGIIRDIPLNKKRNFGIGLGFGYSYNLLYTNLIKNNNIFTIVSMEDEKITKNYYEYHQVDFIPFEIRWRTSTPYSHKFWRLYTGIKYSHTFSVINKVEKITENRKTKIDSKTLGNWKIYMAIGHNTWNLYLQYGISPLFKDNFSEKINTLNMGVIFYIL